MRTPFLLLVLVMAWAQPLSASESDPWEGWNRKVDAFNQFGDRWVVKPVATAYEFITPQIVDDGVTNMYRNIREPITIINDLLQLKIKKAGVDTGRLLLNSTVGLLGFFDVASKAGLQRQPEDFGQTLGTWGVPPGPYVVLPLIGPSNVRDAFSLVPDSFSNPIAYIDQEWVRYSTVAGYYLDLRANALDVEELVTGDEYVFVRDAYLQDREYQVKDGAVEDDFGDEDF